jgi:hypothetical protein
LCAILDPRSSIQPTEITKALGEWEAERAIRARSDAVRCSEGSYKTYWPSHTGD